MRAPALQTILLTVSALLMPVASLLIPVGSFKSDPGQAVTPPGVFFSIWGLVIIGCSAVALLAWVHPDSETVRRVGWPLVVAQAGFSVWLVFAHVKDTYVVIGSIATVVIFGIILTSLLIALARLRTAPSAPFRWLVAGTVGLYAGWSSAAIWLNITTVLPAALADSQIVQTAGVAAAAIGVTAVILTLRPAPSYPGAAIWALVGHRPVGVHLLGVEPVRGCRDRHSRCRLRGAQKRPYPYEKGNTMADVEGDGTQVSPWVLKTPPGTSSYTLYRDEAHTPPILVCTVRKTVLHYDLRCIEDLHAMLKVHGDWMELGSADEQNPARDGTVEAWARSEQNPIGGWYGLKKGLRGRFAMYVPPLLEALGLAEVEHNARGNRMRAR